MRLRLWDPDRVDLVDVPLTALIGYVTYRCVRAYYADGWFWAFTVLFGAGLVDVYFKLRAQGKARWPWEP